MAEAKGTQVPPSLLQRFHPLYFNGSTLSTSMPSPQKHCLCLNVPADTHPVAAAKEEEEEEEEEEVSAIEADTLTPKPVNP